MANGTFHIEVAREEDLPSLMAIYAPSFEHIPLQKLLGHIDTPEARQASGQLHLQAWREHAKISAQPCGIKCVNSGSNGDKTIIGFAEWFIFDQPRSEEQYRQLIFLHAASWVSSQSQQEKARAWVRPLYESQWKWMGGRPYGSVKNMCIDKAWRRRGASTLCVQWGIDRCRELRIPVYLESSDEGEGVYKKLGFETVDRVSLDWDGLQVSFPVMILWPLGTAEEDKKPALP